jgi:hypothetical protein
LNLALNPLFGKSFVMVSRRSALLIAAAAACMVLAPLRAHAQWWSSKPADFEDCADRAEKAKEERAAKLSECHSKFAGRRKAGGGYTYFDFMQNRHFDIAGPNPTPEEQKQIDEQYIAYLDQERRSSIAAAFAVKQQQQQQQIQQQQVQQASLKTETEKVPVPRQSPVKQQAAASELRARAKAAQCARDSFSCEWPRLSDSLNDIKKLFGAAQAKADLGSPSPRKPGSPRERN